jgi:hypothetical protein
MTDRAAPRPTPWLAAGLAISVLAAAGALVACSSDGTTPKCSDLPLYDVAHADASDIAKRKKLEPEGCFTPPGDGGSSTTNPPPDSGTD